MAEKSYPWLDVGGDRTVTADMERQAAADAGFIGVVGGLAPTKNGAAVNVAAGTAVINGVTYVLDATATVEPPAGTRKDYVVLRYVAADRAISLAVLQGSGLAFPTLTRSSAIYEIAIAKVDNSSGAFAVTDARPDPTICGMRDTGWISGGFAAASGWSVSGAKWRRVGSVVSIKGTATRTGSAISTPASGDVANLTVATLPTGLAPAEVQGVGSGSVGRLVQFAAMTDGTLALVSAVPADISTGQDLSFSGVYLMD